VELDFSCLTEGAPNVLDNIAKSDPESKEDRGTTSVVEAIPDEIRAMLPKV
jgi:hypothetical protein